MLKLENETDEKQTGKRRLFDKGSSDECRNLEQLVEMVNFFEIFKNFQNF